MDSPRQVLNGWFEDLQQERRIINESITYQNEQAMIYAAGEVEETHDQ